MKFCFMHVFRIYCWLQYDDVTWSKQDGEIINRDFYKIQLPYKLKYYINSNFKKDNFKLIISLVILN